MASCELGVCYFPEHWPEAKWAEDAAQMADLGLKQIRLGEFAWSRIEPTPGDLQWGWLDRALETLGNAGLTAMLCTPTATPPKWLVDAHPDILAHDKHGKPRRFGSRRHYCFSSDSYRDEARRIVTLLAERYGQHPVVTGWQTDNEYGCHDTVRSYSPAAEQAFRGWLNERYCTPEALNAAWGTVFWSQEYTRFDQVDLPNLTVTEPNPSHVLDFNRFSAHQVATFNKMQVDILRAHSPGRDVVHNFMGFYFDFDHFEVGESLDAVGWDSYPLGFLDVRPYPLADKQDFMRQGHPDFAAFFHDLYRACGRGRWQVIEQQPGPVNWAHHNTAPLPGMVRLWTLEAAAHGAEAVKYFRWRQAPFAQEQMHAGLQRPDGSFTREAGEVRQCAGELAALPPQDAPGQADVAIIFDYDAEWLFEAQPQGAGWTYHRLVMDWYSAARSLGLNVDILSPKAHHDGYALILVPSLPVVSEAFAAQMASSKAHYVLGPRCGAKTETLTIPDGLAPGPLADVLQARVTHAESFADWHRETGTFKGESVSGSVWLDHVETELRPIVETPAGNGLLFEIERYSFFTTVPDGAFLKAVLSDLCERAGQSVLDLPRGLRLRRNGNIQFALNYASSPIDLPDACRPPSGRYLIGGPALDPAGVAAWLVD
ncbi:MAG: beta-galactosidase [Pseudomonadota bacterium]